MFLFERGKTIPCRQGFTVFLKNTVYPWLLSLFHFSKNTFCPTNTWRFVHSVSIWVREQCGRFFFSFSSFSKLLFQTETYYIRSALDLKSVTSSSTFMYIYLSPGVLIVDRLVKLIWCGWRLILYSLMCHKIAEEFYFLHCRQGCFSFRAVLWLTCWFAW